MLWLIKLLIQRNEGNLMLHLTPPLLKYDDCLICGHTSILAMLNIRHIKVWNNNHLLDSLNPINFHISALTVCSQIR